MKVYITFGQIHTHSINGKTMDKNCIGAIEAKDYESGRLLAMEWFNGLFHDCYEEAQLTEEIKSYYPRGIIQIN